MPRPIPLTNLASGRYNTDENGQVTPRTPHSRTARLEGGFARLQVTEANDFDPRQTFAQQQSAPLLASSTSARFAGVRSGKPRGLEPPPQSAREHMSPMARIMAWLGIALAAILLLLLALSYTNQDMLFTTMGLPTVHHILDDARTQIIPPSHKPTAFYPNYTQFPLTGKQYRDECAKQMGQFMSHGNYWDPPHHEHGMLDAEHSNDARICRSSITYSLDGQVGLAADLALMAQVAALARERNRTFFVDDTHWDRGWWSKYFEDPTKLQPGPEPGCLPPPPEELVACPRTARHWVVSALTARYHLGHEFLNHYENAYKHELNRERPIFKFAKTSFESTIRPSKAMVQLIDKAKDELLQQFPTDEQPFIVDEHSTADKPYISVHVRRGDRLPQGWGYHRNPIPLAEYISGVKQVFEDQSATTPSNPEQGLEQKKVVIYFASDAPAEIYKFEEVYRHGPVFGLAKSKHAELRALASPGEYFQARFDMLSADARRRATMGALIDLAITSGLWNSESGLRHHAAVCTASSNYGRLAAVGLGWERAFGNVDEMGVPNKKTMRWIDVDLKGSELPLWKAFELF